MRRSLIQELEARLPLPGQYLPALRALAAQFGVAVPTIRRALRQLAREGRVYQRVPRGRFAVPQPQTDAPGDSFAAISKEHVIAEGLWNAWLAGEHWAGPAFPPVRNLMRRFEAGFEMVHRALSLMEHAGKIRRSLGGAISWIQTRPGSGCSEVYLVGDPDLVRSYSGPFFELLTALETELFRDNWGQLRFWLTRTPLQSRSPAVHRTAALIHPLHGPAKDWRIFMERAANVPVAIIDLDARHQRMVSARKGSVRLELDHHGAGAAVADSLRSLNHRDVVFLSQLEPESYPWLEERWKGFQENWKLGKAHFLYAPSSAAPAASHRSRNSAPEVSPRVSTGTPVPESTARLMREGAQHLRQLEMQFDQLAQLFEIALELRSVTAWVCANDNLALMALRFLRDKGIKVPDQISVVGFDNSREGFVAGLASYDFGLPSLAHAAVAFFKNSRIAVGKSGIWKAPGSMRNRESLGQAHRR